MGLKILMEMVFGMKGKILLIGIATVNMIQQILMMLMKSLK